MNIINTNYYYYKYLLLLIFIISLLLCSSYSCDSKNKGCSIYFYSSFQNSSFICNMDNQGSCTINTFFSVSSNCSFPYIEMYLVKIIPSPECTYTCDGYQVNSINVTAIPINSNPTIDIIIGTKNKLQPGNNIEIISLNQWSLQSNKNNIIYMTDFSMMVESCIYLQYSLDSQLCLKEKERNEKNKLIAPIISSSSSSSSLSSNINILWTLNIQTKSYC